jgi:hypothetical protein
MRIVRSVAVSIAALAASTVLPAPPALAGGAVFEFGRRYFAPDQVVVGHTTLSLHGTGSGKLRDGPYFAYLIPLGVSFGPSHIPDVAVPLGAVRMHRLDPSWLVRATIRFRVPDVARGVHEVAICNSPCRDTVVGDLVGGWFSIVGSPSEARLRERIDRLAAARTRAEHRLEAELWAMRREHAAAARRTTGVITKLRERMSSISARLIATETEVGALRAARSTPAAPQPERSLVDRFAWPLAGAITVVAIVLLLFRRRRGSPPPPRLADGSPHPDFVFGAADGPASDSGEEVEDRREALVEVRRESVPDPGPVGEAALDPGGHERVPRLEDGGAREVTVPGQEPRPEVPLGRGR